nr:hypothetical protein [Tanacetum cinerariifolium]
RKSAAARRRAAPGRSRGLRRRRGSRSCLHLRVDVIRAALGTGALFDDVLLGPEPPGGADRHRHCGPDHGPGREDRADEQDGGGDRRRER